MSSVEAAASTASESRLIISASVPHLRWWLAALLAAATAINYLDRQSFPVVVTEMQKYIAISNQRYSQLQMLFLLAYAVMYAGGGKIADVLGTKNGYSLMILGWSFATILHGFVNSVLGLGLARFLLGLGEGGSFPCSAKAVSEWFPPEERALAFGIFNTGSSVGAVIAPPLIAVIVLTLNWRWAFFLTGALGAAWLICWQLFYGLQRQCSPDCAEEHKHFTKTPGAAEGGKARLASPRIPWRELFRYRQVWVLLAAKFLTDAAWFFFIFWLPKYLSDARHLNIKQIGYYAWIPYAFAGGGSFVGGWLSTALMRLQMTVNASRKICLAASAVLMPLSMLIPESGLSMTLALFSMALFAHQFWSTILQTLPADMFPSEIVGSVAGLMGSAGSIGAMLFDLFVGSMLTHYHDYSQVFIISGLLHPAGLLFILLLVPEVGLVKRKPMLAQIA